MVYLRVNFLEVLAPNCIMQDIQYKLLTECMTMMKNIIRMCFKVVLLFVLATWLIIGGCTAYITKEFHLQKSIDNYYQSKTEEWDSGVGPDILPELFEEWRIFIGITSVHKNPYNREKYSNIYSVGFNFVHLMDSMASPRIDIPPPSNIIEDELSIDTVNIMFFPSKVEYRLLVDSVLTLGQRPILPFLKRSIDFDSLYIPENIDTINVSFNIRLFDEDGFEKAKKAYSFQMIKYYDKYLSIPPGLLH